MKFCLYIVIIIAFCGMLSSCKKDRLQWQHWQWIETNTTDRLNTLYFINDSIGFAVGGERFYNAAILTTRDGGKSWKYQSYPEAGKSLFGITQSPSGVLYAVGFDGKLLISEDTGRSWQTRQISYLPYKDIYFPSPDRGLLVGGISYTTGYRNSINSNGNAQLFDSLTYELNDIEMYSPKTGYIAGFGVVLKTTDSGNTWQEQEIQNDNFTAVHALTINEAWTSGYNGSIFHTTDGGQHWDKLRNGNSINQPRYRLLDILFKDSQHGYACGEDGIMIYTDDGGKHWMEYQMFTKSALRSIWLMKDGSLLVCGDNGGIYRLNL